MKRKWKNVNKCSSCGERCVHFIWTSSRQVNNGIRTMYPDSKICWKCYEKMKATYPPISRHNNSPTQCPLCKSQGIVKEKICNLDGDNDDNHEYVCQECGCVLQEDEIE